MPRIVAECREPLTQPPYYRDGVQELLLCDYGLFREQRRGPLHANDPAALALVLPQDDVHASLVDRIDAYLEHHYADPIIQFTMCDIRMQLLQAIKDMRDAHEAHQPVRASEARVTHDRVARMLERTAQGVTDTRLSTPRHGPVDGRRSPLGEATTPPSPPPPPASPQPRNADTDMSISSGYVRGSPANNVFTSPRSPPRRRARPARYND